MKRKISVNKTEKAIDVTLGSFTMFTAIRAPHLLYFHNLRRSSVKPPILG